MFLLYPNATRFGHRAFHLNRTSVHGILGESAAEMVVGSSPVTR